MEPLGIWLAAVGLADAFVDLSGEVPRTRDAFRGWLVGIAASSLLGIAFGLPITQLFVLVLITGITSGAWIWSRSPADWSSLRAAILLAGLGITVVSLTASVSLWSVPTDSLVAKGLAVNSFDRLADVSAGTLAVVAGVLVFLQASGNAVVRLLLALVATSPGHEEELRGGRLIGPLERTLIFSLAIGGQPTAAALVISAKSVLRFPELSKQEDRIHGITEYFLVGSLASWLLALAGAGLALIAIP